MCKSGRFKQDTQQCDIISLTIVYQIKRNYTTDEDTYLTKK